MTNYRFPKQGLRGSRSELDVSLSALGGTEVPSDLEGDLYFIAATGDLDHPSPFDRNDNTSFLSGDGMISRVSFREGEARLKTRLVRTPSFYADEAAQGTESSFVNMGISRHSPALGVRNFANTALIPFRRAAESPTRLLATYDAGRPMEVDPRTLDVITPVGRNDEWEPTLFKHLPFPLLGSTAHPAHAPDSGETFLVNYVRDARSLMGSLAVLERLDARISGPLGADAALLDAADVEGLGNTKGFGDTLKSIGTWLKWALEFLKDAIGDPPDARTRLLRWTDKRDLEAWDLNLPSGEPVSIRQSCHQLAVTENFIVLVDTAFKFELDMLISNFGPIPKRFRRLLRKRLSRAQKRRTMAYLVPRSELTKAGPITVVPIRLPASVTHYEMSFRERPNGCLEMVTIDQSATDPSEILGTDDLQQYATSHRAIPRRAVGMMPGSLDLNAILVMELDPISATAVRKIVDTRDHHWTVGLLAGPTVLAGNPSTGRIDTVFYYTHGFVPEMVSELIHHLYSDYDDVLLPRHASLESIRQLAAAGGSGATLNRMTFSNGQVHHDHTTFSADTLITSPQFIPGTNRNYIATCAFTDDTKEIWIFDADDLSAPPVRLGLPDGQLPWPYALHSCWLTDAEAEREFPYQISGDTDFPEGTREREFLEQRVFPHLPKQDRYS